MTSIDAVFAALCSPPRREIVERLSEGACSVQELAAHIDGSVSATLQHIAKLEACGLVRTAKHGRTRTCRLDIKTFSTAEKWFGTRRARLQKSFDRLEMLLTNKRDLDS